MQRLAAPMIGGLASATLLTLVVLPAAYLLVLRSTVQGGADEGTDGAPETRREPPRASGDAGTESPRSVQEETG
jgi:Cu(I)/Ag(I) efflux system membrane protein CusA/SilA